MSVLATALGKIRGLSDGNVNTYLGVRYGQPPVGAMRFKASQMAEAWPDIYDATQYPNRAMQEKTLSTLGLPVGGAVSEDCLLPDTVSQCWVRYLMGRIEFFYSPNYQNSAKHRPNKSAKPVKPVSY